LKYRKGICTECGEEDYIVKRSPLHGDFCKKCNDVRLTTKNADKPKRKRIKRVKNYTGERELFMDIWNDSKKCSFLSGKSLIHLANYKDDPDRAGLFYSCFAHVLPKASNKYPLFRVNRANIVLLTPEEHNLLDFGTEEQRQKYAEKNDCRWKGIYELRERLKRQYKELTKH